MKILSEKTALVRLREIKAAFRARVTSDYEHRAKDCLTCETKGVCCLDAHFVNVHVTRLEAVEMLSVLENYPAEEKGLIFERIDKAIEKYDLESPGDTFEKTYSCPLFEPGIGCTVHAVKPVPCIQHACYENKADLPPDSLQSEVEEGIDRLNRKTYRLATFLLPLPVWIKKLREI